MPISGQTQGRLGDALCDQDAANQIITAINLGAASPILTSGTDATHLGFFGIALATQRDAYTQTYTSTDRTNPDLTATAVPTDAATDTSPFGYTEAQANAMVATVNALIDDLTAVKKVLNALIDDSQAYGLST